MSSTSSNTTELTNPSAGSTSSVDAFDVTSCFDRWVQDVQSQKAFTSEAPETGEVEGSEIYIGSFPGSNCEVTFEGVLHFDGYSIGNISSPAGTLVLTKRGRIEADINVGIALINGAVTGNITASERVVLDSDARVTGHIRTRALAVRLGAVFDGECLFIGDAEAPTRNSASAANESEELQHFVAGARS
jgi:cytoskeletal protein CcmA (bactofilin family)